MHDAFLGLTEWGGYMPNGDRLQLDIHQYLCFNGQSADDYSVRVKAGQPCTAWAKGQNASMTNFGMTHVGEFSLGINDCGQWLNGVKLGARFDGTFSASDFPVTGDCMQYLNYPNWDAAWKASMKQFALQSMSALQVSTVICRCVGAVLTSRLLELVLLDLEDRQFDSHGYPHVTCLVLPAWSSGRLDAD